jgi:hypothetical protein
MDFIKFDDGQVRAYNNGCGRFLNFLKAMLISFFLIKIFFIYKKNEISCGKCKKYADSLYLTTTIL